MSCSPALTASCFLFPVFRARRTRRRSTCSQRKSAGSGSSAEKGSSERSGRTASWCWEETSCSSARRRWVRGGVASRWLISDWLLELISSSSIRNRCLTAVTSLRRPLIIATVTRCQRGMLHKMWDRALSWRRTACWVSVGVFQLYDVITPR